MTPAPRVGQRGRAPVPTAVRLLTLLPFVLILALAGTLLYGVVRYPDAPLRPAGNGYVGKGGRPHTEEEYEDFTRWESATLIAFPTCLALAAVAMVTSFVLRRRASGPR